MRYIEKLCNWSPWAFKRFIYLVESIIDSETSGMTSHHMNPTSIYTYRVKVTQLFASTVPLPATPHTNCLARSELSVTRVKAVVHKVVNGVYTRAVRATEMRRVSH